jgi:hypothetical protein
VQKAALNPASAARILKRAVARAGVRNHYFGGIDYAPRKLGEKTFWLVAVLREWRQKHGAHVRHLLELSSLHRRVEDSARCVPSWSRPGASLTERQTSLAHRVL